MSKRGRVGQTPLKQQQVFVLRITGIVNGHTGAIQKPVIIQDERQEIGSGVR